MTVTTWQFKSEFAVEFGAKNKLIGTGASGDFKSKRFYKTLLNLIDTMEKDEKQELLTWWNE